MDWSKLDLGSSAVNDDRLIHLKGLRKLIDGPRVASVQPPAYDRIKIDSLILQVLSSGTGGEWVENTRPTGGRRCLP